MYSLLCQIRNSTVTVFFSSLFTIAPIYSIFVKRFNYEYDVSAGNITLVTVFREEKLNKTTTSVINQFTLQTKGLSPSIVEDQKRLTQGKLVQCCVGVTL